MEASEKGNGRKRYLELCTGQMRCKGMRPAVEEELSAHIQDQMEAYRDEGMEEEKRRNSPLRRWEIPWKRGLRWTGYIAPGWTGKLPH